jgi:hypothetical protein
MKRPKIDDYGVGNGYVDLLKFSKDLGKYCDELESRFKSDIAIKLELKTDNFLLKEQNEELKEALKAVDKKLGRNQWPAIRIIEQALKQK